MTSGHDEFCARLVYALARATSRLQAAGEIAQMIRGEQGYRWVGVYEVTATEIRAMAWTGTVAPAVPHFPVTEGLCGAAVASRGIVNVADVRRDPRWLTTFGSTRAEIIVPVVTTTGHVVGLIDVESGQVNAFGEGDERFLGRCAQIILPLFKRLS